MLRRIALTSSGATWRNNMIRMQPRPGVPGDHMPAGIQHHDRIVLDAFHQETEAILAREDRLGDALAAGPLDGDVAPSVARFGGMRFAIVALLSTRPSPR